MIQKQPESAEMLTELNERQRQAVLHGDGPLLVLAGAGSGKTRVITYRAAHLIGERGIAPQTILAVTFTNKAAGEMRERVEGLTGRLSPAPWVSTFHSFCSAVLRRHITAIGFPRGFTIYDVNDQTALLKKVLDDMRTDQFRPADMQARISHAKNSKAGPLAALSSYEDERLTAIYKAYQNALKAAGALDFDDLLLRAIELFESDNGILEHYRNRFEHILVDEYQDTNHPQYRLVRLLAPPHNNICAVGDDDQSIYRWRGADIENILRFEKDFPGATIVKLEQNYRSTQCILDAAHGVVQQLSGRHEKKLWTDRGAGEPVTYFLADSEESEASFIVSQIDSMLGRRQAYEFALLFRTNAQSRPFEEAFARHRIPFQVVGGVRFYERMEIKDVLAYLHLGMNYNDIVSLRRVINNPPRGVGEATIGKLELLAREKGITVWEALDKQIPFLGASTKIKNGLTFFKGLIATISEHITHDERPSEVIDFILKESGYLGALIQQNTDEAMGRIDNLKELIAAAKGFEETNPGAGTAEFLDQAALVADADSYEPDAPRVTLMTLHCAKGLEFNVVFLAGLEEGLLPHSRNTDTLEGIEEERRLCYVGMTRARDRLYLSSARTRRRFDGFIANKPSRFIEDIPEGILNQRGAERRRPRKTTVGANVENIGKFFKDRKIDIDLEKLAKHAAPGGAEFSIGEKVKLDKYGTGKIVGTEGEGDDLRYIVNFRGVGRKKILARLKKLTKA
jgi:DNA helicase-2/ATP-dependent DNA helicase PcrA